MLWQARVSQVRKALAEGAKALETRPGGYLLRLEPEQLDLLRFERLVAEAEGSDASRTAGKLREALALWHGLPLADFTYDDWAQPAIARFEELRLAALEKRIDGGMKLGRHAQLTGELEAVIAADPLRERPPWPANAGALPVRETGRGARRLHAHTPDAHGRKGFGGSSPDRHCSNSSKRFSTGRSARTGGRPVAGAFRARRDPRSFSLAWPACDRRAVEQAAFQGAHPRHAGSRKPRARVGDGAARQPPQGAAFPRNRGADCRLRLDEPGRRSGSPRTRVRRRSGRSRRAVGPALQGATVSTLLEKAPCDVAVVTGGEPQLGQVLVPFVGAEHDWTAIERGAGLPEPRRARSRCSEPKNPASGQRDASRLLASASIAVQRGFGLAAEPLLVARETDEVVRVADEAGMVVTGLSENWKSEGLGTIRTALAARTGSATLLVRRGLRPGGLAPREQLTRFTWSRGHGVNAD